MCESIKESCKLGVAAYAGQSREKWVLEWPGQVVLAVTAIFWTADVTNALKNGVPGGFACVLFKPHMLQCLAVVNLWCACMLRVLLRSLDSCCWRFSTGGVKAVADKCTGQLNNIVGLVRGQLTKLQRSTLSALVVMDVHARDVTANLAAQGIEGNLNDFAWLSQLRMYWEVGVIHDHITQHVSGVRNRTASSKS